MRSGSHLKRIMSRTYRQSAQYGIFGKHRNMPRHHRAASVRLDKEPLTRIFFHRDGHHAISDRKPWNKAPADFRRMHNRIRRARAKNALRVDRDPPAEKKDLDWKWL